MKFIIFLLAVLMYLPVFAFASHCNDSKRFGAKYSIVVTDNSSNKVQVDGDGCVFSKGGSQYGLYTLNNTQSDVEIKNVFYTANCSVKLIYPSNPGNNPQYVATKGKVAITQPTQSDAALIEFDSSC